MKRRSNPYLLVAVVFGIVGISGLATGRTELLAFIALALVFLAIGHDKNQKRPPKGGKER